jgi:hypothetical protein
MRPPEKAILSISDLIVDGALEIEKFLFLYLL